MILQGYCDKIKDNCRIDVDIINKNALEDIDRQNFDIGRINCKYATTVNCNGKDCSLLIQNGYKH